MLRRSIALLLVGILAVACQATASPSAPEASPPSASPAEVPTASAPAPSAGGASASAGAGAGELAIVAREFSYEAPATIPAGPVRITLTNQGKEEHMAQIAKLADGTSLDQLLAALMQNDFAAAFKMMTLVGGPTAVLPGKEQEVAAVLDPGNYALLCFVSSPDGIPHLAKGMVAQLKVTEPASPGQLPPADAELTAEDFRFVGVDSLSAGRHVIHLTNKGPQAHEAGIVSLAPGFTVDDLRSMVTATPPPETAAPGGPGASPSPGGPGASPPAGAAPPVISAGGIAALQPGRDGTLTVNLPAGNYAWICFVPDPASGKPHAALGMIGQLTVK